MSMIPAFEIDFDYLKDVYMRQCDALIDGGVLQCSSTTTH